jgi:hypothetical protein
MDDAMPLLSEATLSDSVTGDKRWNMVLARDTDRLKVTHGDHTLDVSRFRSILLLTEITVTFDPAEPVEYGAELEARVAELQALPELARPVGTASPRRQMPLAIYSPFARRPDVKAWVLRQASGRCELCTLEAPFQADSGQKYLEHHHVIQLAHGGPDSVENSVALCPNCHRRLHLGADRKDQRGRLYSQVTRLEKEISNDGAAESIISPDR